MKEKNQTRLKGRRIVVGICGSIAAYKSCELIRLLVSEGAEVCVLATRNALNFVTPLTLRTLSGRPVIQDLFSEEEFASIMHVQAAHWAETVVIAPATANIIGKIACGLADDVVTSTVMATDAPVIFAPAMNDRMYQNRIYQSNQKRLQEMGYTLVEPGTGYLACGYDGIGRLADTGKIVETVVCVLLPDRKE